MEKWQPSSWQTKTCNRQFHYPNPSLLGEAIAKLSELPPLISENEILTLKQRLAEAQHNKRFILQGGDCAENFHDCNAESIRKKLKILVQMSTILGNGFYQPITTIGRIAGQYAKPRSSSQETQKGVTLPSYQGDLINQLSFDKTSRVPNPKLLLKGYHYSAMTLNYIRTLQSGSMSEFCDLQHNDSKINEFYTSHESFNLFYEQSLTRKSSDNKWYNFSTHFPWTGVRSIFKNSAYIEYLRGIENPIAIKVGPNIDADNLSDIVKLLNPKNEDGRLTLITRLGKDHVEEHLAKLIQHIKNKKQSVLWMCDPMHGNTEVIAQGIKTRRFENICAELEKTFITHEKYDSILGGVHLELTGENVAECLGGTCNLSEIDLQNSYQSSLDPRLNYQQSLEIAMHIVEKKGILS